VPVDHFPSTHATWIDSQLTLADEGGGASPAAQDARRALRQHVMSRYHEALLAYVKGSSLRELGEADDIVAGFFAERVGSPGFLKEWRASGMPLRRWLMNGIGFHGRGLLRDRIRERARQAESWQGGAAATTIDGSPLERLPDFRQAEQDFEEAWALEVLNAAHARVHAELDSAGRLDEYDVFRRHVIDGVEYSVIGADLGLTRQQCANCVRRVSERIREALREELRSEGVPGSELEAELAKIRELLGQSE
jgi:DNA-directed RNA polymerase specialized sigma24 family protein